MSKRAWGIVALIVATVSVVLIALLADGSGAGSSGPDLGACKRAMQRQFDYGMSHPDAPAGTRPPECQGVPDKDVQRFASEIIAHYNGTAQ
jgi:hypothetical protein